MQITSRDNSLLRKTRAVRDGDDKSLIYIEGLRLAEEALISELTIDAVIVSDELARKPKVATLLDALRACANRFATTTEKLLESISFTKTPQGIVVLASRPSDGQQRLNTVAPNGPLLVLMHEINNPVNVGAVIRTAEAAGASGIITTRKTTDPFSPKALRGAMGSAFRLPIWSGTSFQKAIDWCAQHGITSICADAAAPTTHTEVDWRGGRALILGPESTGLKNEEIEMATIAVRIPMRGAVESLNVSVAAGVMLYEAFRQRSS